MSAKTNIRNAIKDVLAPPGATAFPTRAGPHVYTTRSAPITPRMMPAVLIYTQRDQRDTGNPYNQPGGPLRRTLSVAIEAAAAGQDADDLADALCDEIEAALDANMNLGGLCESLHWQSTTFEPVGDGEQAFVVALMEFEVTYWTAAVEDEGETPTRVFASWDPDTGTENETEYRELSEDAPPPPIGGTDCT